MTLATARARVQSVIDDAEEERWSLTEIDAELATAVEQVVGEGASAGLDVFNVTALVTLDGNGRADLSALPGGVPIKLSTVAQLSANTRLSVQPSRRREMLQPATGLAGQSIEITYVPRPAFPTLAGSNITYGSAGVQSAVLDALVCTIAASALKPKEGEINGGLEKRKAELWESMLNTAGNPSCYVLPFSSWPAVRSPYRWIVAGQSLQLFIDQGG